LTDHLRELYVRVFKALIILAFACIACLVFSETLIDFVLKPIPPEVQKRTGELLEGFQTRITVSIYFGVFFSLPFIAHQIYAFIRPALRIKEDRTVRLYLFLGYLLMTVAIVFVHLILAHIIDAFNSYVPLKSQVNIQADIGNYTRGILTIYLGFAIVFQVPLIVFLSLMQDFVDIKVYTEHRKWVIVVLLILSAMFSPPDLQSMFLLFVPIYSLFELALILGRLFSPKKQDVRT